ncbi:toll-like receptor 4 [Haliotis rubra]|uniref:toll-like receptor 4 n=1 Tax=Haliotis rubra TaxID=36100 RepID=UPI001EE578BE|nr:toll-like receptor 4 [Haliotis rubra]
MFIRGLQICWIVTVLVPLTHPSLCTMPTHACGDGHCVCHATCADCSGKNLTFIPRLDAGTSSLDISWNVFTAISHALFLNITTINIETLKIDNCRIQHMAADTFQEFTNLTSLSMNYNPVSSLTPALTTSVLPRLSILHASDLNISDMTFIYHMKAGRLGHVFLNYNQLRVYNHSVFSNKIYIVTVNVNHNRISQHTFVTSTSLQHLGISENYISTCPTFCEDDDNTPIFPNLRYLDFGFNFLSSISNVFKCLPKLETLCLSGNPIRRIASNTFVGLPNLFQLLLRSLPEKPDIESYAFNSSRLRGLYLTNSHISFGTQVHEDAFRGIHIHNLDVTANRFKDVTEDQMLNFFGHLKYMENFDMGSCQLQNIPLFLQKMKHLNAISLYSNIITKIPEGIISNLTHLRKLWLDQNEIATISEHAIPKHLREQLSVINLADNPFTCDCSLRWFIDWVQRNSSLFKQYPKRYVCNSPDTKRHVMLKDIAFSPNACYLTLDIITTMLVSLSVIIVVVCSISFLYKLRWRIRHFIYMKYYRPKRQRNREHNQDYTYDAYIIHSDDDEDWVVDEMIPKLEEQHHLKLCIPSRNFCSGYILDNIDLAIQTSRHIIVVLSPSFADSDWCQAGLMMAQSFVLDIRADALITVLLGEPDARNLSHSLHRLLIDTAYITWGEEDDARASFWARLTTVLKEGMRSMTDCECY